MFYEIITNVKETVPIIHNITNYVTANDCANILLACGASPIMADDIVEVEEITSFCNALVINIGTLNGSRISSMHKAGKMANELKHPVVLDPVGVGASKFRMEAVLHLLKEIRFDVIRGNISEIKSIAFGIGIPMKIESMDRTEHTKGIDAKIADYVEEDILTETIMLAENLSARTGAVIVITGAIDIAAYHSKAYIIRNGHQSMSKITGTGCMLSSVIGAFCSVKPYHILEATATAVCAMGICGEKAYEKMIQSNSGTSSLRMYLIDYMSKLDAQTIEQGAKVELYTGALQ